VESLAHRGPESAGNISAAQKGIEAGGVDMKI
jgi:hypothetical protein